MLDHGGNLNDAVRRYGRPRADWVDLSTGINPHPYPSPALAADAWHRLPEHSDMLIQAAQDYYRAPYLLAVAGTQAAIQALPGLRSHARVAIAAPSYAEHRHHWQQAGHQVVDLAYADLASALPDCDVMVVCNPNNPTGETIVPGLLAEWSAQLAARGGCLIVDEAFGDVLPELSVANMADRDGLIVLRSVGKFFGLAGLRLGFVAARPALLATLANRLGPWTVSGPAQQIGAAALSDRVWQEGMRDRLQAEGKRLRAMLAGVGITSHGCDLYRYWPEPRAAQFAENMAVRGIWIRQFAHGVRLGLPAREADWQRLNTALQDWIALKDRK